MIGIFDSGLGGLAILRQVRRLLPRTGVTYLADTEAFPYGPKGAGFLLDRTEKISRTLAEAGAELIVVACNTATVVAIENLRHSFSLPFVGVEPAVKVAAGLAPPMAPIIVLLTENSASGSKYTSLVSRFAAGRRVEAICLSRLAQVVEDGSFTKASVAAEIVQTVRKAVGPVPAGAQVVLGCTHYTFLLDILGQALGPGANLLEPSRQVAQQVLRLVRKRGLPENERGEIKYLCTGDAENFARRATRLLDGNEVKAEKINIEG